MKRRETRRKDGKTRRKGRKVRRKRQIEIRKIERWKEIKA